MGRHSKNEKRVELPKLEVATEREVHLVTVGRNFTDYMEEWLEYHLLVGFHRIVVGLNECGDDLARAKGLLQRFTSTRFTNGPDGTMHARIQYDPICECSKALCHMQLYSKVYEQLGEKYEREKAIGLCLLACACCSMPGVLLCLALTRLLLSVCAHYLLPWCIYYRGVSTTVVYLLPWCSCR
jgi:hypothetical protein